MTLVVADLPDELGGDLYLPLAGGSGAIALYRRLTQVQRNCALAHELVHDERGGGSDYTDAPGCWGAVAAREELWTDDEAVRRLVPHAALNRL